jgi:short-subunit dehydrogenase
MPESSKEPAGWDNRASGCGLRFNQNQRAWLLNTVQPLIPRMTARGRGQIAIVGLIAGFIPLPDAPSYSSSKSAVLNYGRALRDALVP